MRSPLLAADAELLQSILAGSPLLPFSAELERVFAEGWKRVLAHGDAPRWLEAVGSLPSVSPSEIDMNADAVRIGRATDLAAASDPAAALMGLHPWRKGPFDYFGCTIDTEWRSDWKWQRFAEAIAPLAGRTVLDVGCGSGYHLWRMVGAGAKLAVGIDPTPLFAMQFAAMQRSICCNSVLYLPVGIDDLPAGMGAFDTVFSMGVLYHRRSPIDHLLQLRGQLRPGGELLLETLVIEGDERSCLLPRDRYARMRNVWFIPSAAMLGLWLERCGFSDIRLLDITATGNGEQRRTDWMQFESLADFLDPADASRTAEGYPAPLRACFSAKAI